MFPRVGLLHLFMLLIITSGVWADVDRLSFALQFLFCATALLLLAADWFLRDPILASERTSLTFGSVGIGLAVSAPVLLYLFTTANQEFPFSGDHDHHLLAHKSVLEFWTAHYTVLALPLLSIICMGLKCRKLEILSASGALAYALLVGRSVDLPPYLTRYPGVGYFAGLPLDLLWDRQELPNLMWLSRLSSALAIPTWLFVLRPLSLRQWPNTSVFLFGAFIFWQRDVVYYMTTNYLEPWSLVFLALGVEHFLTEGEEVTVRTTNAMLFAGVAAMVKEPAILVVPWFAVTCLLFRDRLSWRPRLVLVAASVAALAPFFFYQQVRSVSGVSRTFSLAPTESIFSLSRVVEWGWRAQQQFYWSGIVMCLSLIMGALFASRTVKGSLLPTLVLLGAFIAQVVFFFIDGVSTYWTGYPRFHLQALVLLAAILFLVRKVVPFPVLLALVMIGNAPGLMDAFSLARGPDIARSFTEHYDAPIFLPFRALLEIARTDDEYFHSISKVVVNMPADLTHAFVPSYISYGKLSQGLQFESRTHDNGGLACSCDSPDQAVIAFDLNHNGLNRVKPLNEAVLLAVRDCHSTLVRTCNRVVKADGGLIGYGVAKKRADRELS